MELRLMMTDSEKAFCNEYAVTIALTVQWGDMDAFQHVNNVVYLRWFESARIEYLQKIGVMDLLQQSGIGPVLASNAARYRIPIEFPDSVIIGVASEAYDSSNIIQRYGVFSCSKQALATTGEARLVMFDFKQQSKASVPEEVLANIEQFEAKRRLTAIC